MMRRLRSSLKPVFSFAMSKPSPEACLQIPSSPILAMFILIYNSHNSSPVAVFDLKKKRFLSNHLGLGLGGSLSSDLAYHECHGYKASVSNLAQLPRTARGGIEAGSVPLRLPLDSLQAVLTKALTSKGRPPGDLLRPLRGGLTAENRYQKDKIITDTVIASAISLRTDGHTWATTANALGVQVAALKTAHRRSLQQTPCVS